MSQTLYELAIKSIGVIEATTLLSGLGDKTLQIATQVEKAEIQYQALVATLKLTSGSASATTVNLGFINAEVDKLALRLPNAVEGFVRLNTAARGTILEGQGVKEIFDSLSTASRVYSLEGQKLDRVYTAIEQSISKGQIYAEEFRGQLGESLPGAMQILARALGKTVGEVNKDMELGRLGLAELLKFAQQLKKETEGGLTDALNTTGAAADQFGTASNRAGRALAQSGLDQGFRAILQAGTVLLDMFTALPAPMQIALFGTTALAIAVGSLTAAYVALSLAVGGSFYVATLQAVGSLVLLGATNVAAAGSSVLLTTATNNLKFALGSMAAMARIAIAALNPVTILATAVAAAITAISFASKQQQDARKVAAEILTMDKAQKQLTGSLKTYQEQISRGKVRNEDQSNYIQENITNRKAEVQALLDSGTANEKQTEKLKQNMEQLDKSEKKLSELTAVYRNTPPMIDLLIRALKAEEDQSQITATKGVAAAQELFNIRKITAEEFARLQFEINYKQNQELQDNLRNQTLAYSKAASTMKFTSEDKKKAIVETEKKMAEAILAEQKLLGSEQERLAKENSAKLIASYDQEAATLPLRIKIAETIQQLEASNNELTNEQLRLRIQLETSAGNYNNAAALTNELLQLETQQLIEQAELTQQLNQLNNALQQSQINLQVAKNKIIIDDRTTTAEARSNLEGQNTLLKEQLELTKQTSALIDRQAVGQKEKTIQQQLQKALTPGQQQEIADSFVGSLRKANPAITEKEINAALDKQKTLLQLSTNTREEVKQTQEPSERVRVSSNETNTVLGKAALGADKLANALSKAAENAENMADSIKQAETTREATGDRSGNDSNSLDSNYDERKYDTSRYGKKGSAGGIDAGKIDNARTQRERDTREANSNAYQGAVDRAFAFNLPVPTFGDVGTYSPTDYKPPSAPVNKSPAFSGSFGAPSSSVFGNPELKEADVRKKYAPNPSADLGDYGVIKFSPGSAGDADSIAGYATGGITAGKSKGGKLIRVGDEYTKEVIIPLNPTGLAPLAKAIRSENIIINNKNDDLLLAINGLKSSLIAAMGDSGGITVNGSATPMQDALQIQREILNSKIDMVNR